MGRIGVVGLLALVFSTGLAVLGAAGAAGQGEPATFGYTVENIGIEPDVSEDGGLVLSLGGDVAPAQTDAVCRLVRVELATGIETHLSAPPSPEACAGDLAFAPDGTLYGLLQGIDPETGEPFPELVRFDAATGAAEVVGNIGTASQMFGGLLAVPYGGITFDANGQLLVLLVALDEDGADPACRVEGIRYSTCLYRIDDPSNPTALTFLGRNAEIPDGEDGVVGQMLFATCEVVYSTPGRVQHIQDEFYALFGSDLATVDPATGARTTIGAFPDPVDDTPGIVSWGAAADPADGLWGIGLDYPPTPFVQHVITIDPAASPVAANGAEIPDDDGASVQALAIAPLDCTPDPIVLEPTFTG